MAKTKQVKKTALTKYSVLLLYPDYVADTYGESYYTFVSAKNPKSAILKAQREAIKANSLTVSDPDDLKAILVIKGHNEDLMPS